MTATQFLQLAKRYGKYCDHVFAPLAQAHSFTMREVNVLLFLANDPCYDTSRDITEYRGISKSQVSQAVDFLVDMGYLKRTADAEDRRVIHLSLTPSGRDVAAQAQALQTRCGQDLLQGMTEEQVRQLSQLWNIILSNGERLAEEAGV